MVIHDPNLVRLDRIRQRILRELQWLQKVLAQNLAWMSWWKIGHCSDPLTVSRPTLSVSAIIVQPGQMSDIFMLTSGGAAEPPSLSGEDATLLH